MARITHSELAPDEAVRYSLANESFELGGADAEFETNDPVVISNANAHPWLSVEVDLAEDLRGSYVEPSVRPEDDALAAGNSVAFDPDEIRKVEESKRSVDADPTAIEAGLDQGEEVEDERGVDYTLAAASDDEDYEVNE